MTGRVPPTFPTAHRPSAARTTMPESPHDPISDPAVAAFFALHDNLARQGPGSDATTRHLLSQRAHAADLAVPGMREAVTATLQEITMRREHGADYQYTSYVLHPQDKETNPTMTSSWTTRPESAGDVAAIRDINLAAFPSPHEADLVEALRADPQAWLPGMSWLTEAPGGDLTGYALLTRCHVDDSPALALGPCAVRPEHQRQGAGSAAIRAALHAARQQGENLVVVLGHAEYYPRFGFTPASGYGVRPPFDVEDKYMMALALDPERPVPGGVIRYPAAFGV